MKAHLKAMDLVNSDKKLNLDERFFIVENYREDATNMNASAGAFFTPVELATSFQVELDSNLHIVDLCAGIGTLSLLTHVHNFPKSLTCVELNPEYVKVGKRVVPEADWICADALTHQFDGSFDLAISNPPFGVIKTSDWNDKYTGSLFEFKVIERASQISDYAVMIIPANSAGFIQSGVVSRKTVCNKNLEKFIEQTGICFQASCVDTSFASDDWNGAKPQVEIITSDFREIKASRFSLVA